jgi:hypothetical protein
MGENAAEYRDEDGHLNHPKDARGYYPIGLAPPRIVCDVSLLLGLLNQTISVGSRDRLFMQLSDCSCTPSVCRQNPVEIGRGFAVGGVTHVHSLSRSQGRKLGDP